jgi:Fe-S oxidoreductase
MCTSSLNIFLQSLGSRGEIREIPDIEEQERWGNSKIEHFTWKQLLDLDACTRCGRCEANCPAHATEKPLSPKKIIGDLKCEMERLPSLPKPPKGEEEDFQDGRPALVGEVVEDEANWACTTCLSCLEHCPVEISAADKIMDMRRHMVLMESRFPQEVQTVFEGMENNSNPYKMSNDSRLDFLKGVEDVKLFSDCPPDERPELLYFAGCASSFDPRNQKVAIAFVQLLKKAGVDFAMLGPEEGCCGETGRRLGNEYLAQALMQTNVETFKNYGVKKIVTSCPHCFNTFKNEYHQFGAELETVSHVELLMQLIDEGRLKPTKEIPGRILYHDSCYLGRHNGVYDRPRDILYSIPGLRPAEFERNREHAFCCGCGGGRMWLEETVGERINEVRTDEALAEKPDMIGVACPYCMTMFTDGLKAKGASDRVRAVDLAELLLEAL